MNDINEITTLNNSPILLINTKTNKVLNINEHNLYYDFISSENKTILQEEYLDLIREDTFEVFGKKVNFSDNIWDFSELKPDYIQENHFKYSFINNDKTNFTNYYETLLKLFVLDMFIKDGRIRSYVYIKLNYNKRFLKYLMDNDIHTLNSCTEQVISVYKSMLRNKNKEENVGKHMTSIYQLFSFYSLLTARIISSDIINILKRRNKNIIQTDQKNSLLKLLPSDFMHNLTNSLYDNIMLFKNYNNKNECLINRKMTLIFLLTQTGVRPNEVFIIPYDCIIEEKFGDLTAYMLKYNITKTKNGQGMIENRTIANQKVLNVIQHLKEYYKGKYLGDNITNNQLRNFFYKYCENNYKILKNITEEPNKHFMGPSKSIYIDGKKSYINIPILKQFRVYFDSELKRRGYNDFSRAKLLGHKDEKMLDYYGRDMVGIEEDINFAGILIKDFTNNEDFKILGSKGNIYTRKINDFLKNKMINGVTDINQLAKELMNIMPIRSKLGGCCIKPYSNADCNHDEITDELLCSYGLCENQCHFFYNCSYYYKQFKEMTEIYKYNINEGFMKFADKELFKIQHLLKEKLIPELDELNRMIELNGKDYIRKTYKNIDYVIDNQDKIREEINTWIIKRT